MLLPERRRGMARVFLPGPDHSMKRGIRKVVREKRIPGRVNHGITPLEHWWWAGFRRDPRDWARSRIWQGTSGLVFPCPPPHEMRREAMRWGWFNHQDNLAEREVCAYVPRTAEFHLIGMRFWLSSKDMQRPRKPWERPVRPWEGPYFRRTVRTK